jgi:hypothetical protein
MFLFLLETPLAVGLTPLNVDTGGSGDAGVLNYDTLSPYCALAELGDSSPLLDESFGLGVLSSDFVNLLMLL